MALHVHLESRLPEPLAVSAYYIICEALANAAKHAKATAIDVSVEAHGDLLDLSVQDEGADPRGPGLTGLGERVSALAGTMQLLSPRGRGTHLRIRLPIRPAHDPPAETKP